MKKKVAVLFSGGKDSCLVAWIAQKEGYELGCLVSIVSKNKESFMFHVPSIGKVRMQAEVMRLPLILKESEGVKEEELEDLENAILDARDRFGVEGVVTGAVGSVYQASRVQKICNRLGLECFNPLWQENQIELLKDLVAENFEVVVVGVAAYPLDEKFLGRVIDERFIEEMKGLREKFDINPAGEGGEFESFVLNCPLFRKGLEVNGFEDFGEENSWRRELEIK
ncbi:MAG: diphthine--ammonia ligase [Candidatus Omnitrophica bacterium]|nr:diphthine--ammonia ligase [Candidatus Omnitrophota bacterium]